MSGAVRVAVAAAVMLLATWAYRENHRTQQVLRGNAALEREIAQASEALGVLRAEWAYLNRPDRLRDLVALNDDRLGLVPMTAEAFADPDAVPTRAEMASPDDASPAVTAAMRP